MDKEEFAPSEHLNQEVDVQYLIKSPHTYEECIESLEAVKKQGPDALNKWYWGCQAGDHTGYAVLEASSESDVLKMVPQNVRSKAKAQRVEQMTSRQIEELHKQMK